MPLTQEQKDKIADFIKNTPMEQYATKSTRSIKIVSVVAGEDVKSDHLLAVGEDGKL